MLETHWSAAGTFFDLLAVCVMGLPAGTQTARITTGHRNSNSMTIAQITLLLPQARGPTTTLSMCE